MWAAADALIAEGLRPTIERVRLKIGRGSPNTVSPMLEAWFATLAPRLDVDSAKNGAEDLPAPVRKAMKTMWETARLSAREEAAKALADVRQTLAADRAALEVRATDLAHQEQVSKERQAALDEALQVARGQNADLTVRLHESHVLSGRRDKEIDDVRSRLKIQEKERDADRRRNDENSKRHADERRRLEERAVASERRLLEELDRERQKAKQAEAVLSEAERRADALRQSLEVAGKALGEKLQKTEAELRSERQAGIG